MFVGPASSGKTTLIYALFGHGYYKYDIRPVPSTDAFVCIVSNCTGNGNLIEFQSDLSQCSLFKEAQNWIDTDTRCGSHSAFPARHVADDNSMFANVVIVDSPGYLLTYFEQANCHYRSAFERLSSLVDHIFLVWAMPLQLHHGFLHMFKDRQVEQDYHVIFNKKGEEESEGFLLDQHKQFVNPLTGSESWKHGNGLINVPKSYDWDFFITYNENFDALVRKTIYVEPFNQMWLQQTIEQLIQLVSVSAKYRFISDSFKQHIEQRDVISKLKTSLEMVNKIIFDEHPMQMHMMHEKIKECKLPLPQDRSFETSIAMIREKILNVKNFRRKSVLRSALEQLIRSTEDINEGVKVKITGPDSLKRLRAARRLVIELDEYAPQ
jgi:GTPase SAR1 family protein